MCRLVAYLGRPILMEKLLIEPKNSLINQSFSAREIEEPLNGDGFGVGWYNQVLNPKPAIFRSVSPAWNNINLHSIAPLIRSSCFMAHVRAATVGVLSESNCHPFQYDRLLMMHNGDAPMFNRLKRPLRARLSDRSYNWIQGQTDTEHLFALFIDHLDRELEKEALTVDTIANALDAMVNELEQMIKDMKIEEMAYLNMVVSDGDRMVGMRYVSDPSRDEALSLYYSEGSRYECEDGICQMLPSEGENRSVMIVSERLTDITDDWKQVPTNHFVMARQDLSVTLRPVGG